MLELRLEPSKLTDRSTVSLLYREPEHTALCYILEDKVREVPGQPVDSWKVPGETAIPAGRYNVVISKSVRFSAKAGHDVFLPLLLKVPGYEGVRIHTGNRPENTEGCLLPGAKAGDDLVLESRAAFEVLYDLIAAEIARGGEVWLTLTRPEQRA